MKLKLAGETGELEIIPDNTKKPAFVQIFESYFARQITLLKLTESLGEQADYRWGKYAPTSLPQFHDGTSPRTEDIPSRSTDPQL